jgi:hypothetical protein
MTKLAISTHRFIGLSTATKDTGVPIGSTWYEYDTGDTYITYDGTNWSIKDSSNSSILWKFGHPVCRSTGVSQSYWAKSVISPYLQKGSGWSIILNGGVQSGSNWAGVYIPVNELLVTQFNTAKWAYYMTGTETMGVNIVLWVHDPTDFDKRAEITQLGSVVEKAAGWDAHEFDSTDTGIFFYGENTTGTGLTAGTQYTWAEFQADALFKTWTIYRVSLEYGWEASGTFDPVWLAQISLNDQNIDLQPTRDDLEAPVFQYHTATTGALATALSPKTPFRLLSVHLKVNTAGTTDEAFTINLDAGRVATVYDTLFLSQNTKTPALTSLFASFGEGYDFMEDDEIDCAWANTENRTYGLTYAFRVLP